MGTVIFGVASGLALQGALAGLAITKPGDYRFAGEIELSVKAHADADGLVRNELTITAPDGQGGRKAKSYALTFGEKTWGVFVKEGKRNPDPLLVTLADRWSIQTFAIATGIDEKWPPEAHGSSMLSEAFLRGHVNRHADPEIVAWARALVPNLKEEPAAAATPELEVRLLAEPGAKPEMVRATFARSLPNHRRLGKHVPLGARIIDGKQLAVTGVYTGVLHTIYGVKMEDGEFTALMTKYRGRRAAFVKKGQVVQVLTLDPKMERDGFLVTKY